MLLDEGMVSLLRKWLGSSTAPVVEEAPRDFAVPDNTRVYAIGDIHGRSGLLQKMLAAIAQDAKQYPGANIIEVFLGDYVDRGMETREVIDLLIAPPPAGHERICLRGNHEEAMLKFLDEPMILREWATFGGYATLASYGIPIPSSMQPANLAQVRDSFKKNLPATHLAFLRNLGLMHQVGDYLFVHAGIHPKVQLRDQTSDHLLWIREPFLQHTNYFEQYVVHGHTPVGAPELRKNRANLDVSAAPKNSLCCLVMEGNQRRTILVTD